MDAQTAAEALRQVIEGDDIPKIGHLLKRVKPEDAARMLPGCRYSLLTYLEHADFWHRVWLGRLEGKKRPRFGEDWRVPDASEFEPIRDSFLQNLQRALDIARAKPFVHSMKDDGAAVRTLIALAVHDAYHIGQIKLLAQASTSTERD